MPLITVLQRQCERQEEIWKAVNRKLRRKRQHCLGYVQANPAKIQLEREQEKAETLETNLWATTVL